MKISVIVPVYNSEKYLPKCIESVVNQTYNNWELILVDDGSADRSSSIADNAAQRDNRIKVIHQQNAGPGEARNQGIDAANGDYVVFLDSDDYIEKDYFKLLVPKAESHDIVFIDVNQVAPDGRLIKEEKMSQYSSWTMNRLLRSQMTGKVCWGGVRKAVRIGLLKDNNIRYTKHTVGEEALYSFRILHAAKLITFLDDKSVYTYVNHESSQSKIEMDDPWGGVVDTLRSYLKMNGLYGEYANTVNAFNATATVVSLDRIARKYEGKERKAKAKECVQKFQSSYERNAGCDTASMSMKAKVFVPFLRLGVYWPVLWGSKLRRLIAE